MTQKRILRLLALAIPFILPACPAIVAYTDLADWQGVTTLNAIENFNTFSPTDTNYTTIGPLSGMTFTSPGYQVQVTDIWGSAPWGTGKYLRASYNFTNLRIDFTTAVTAFANLMMIDNGGSGSSMTVTVRDGAATLYSAALPTLARWTPTFLGVISTTPGQTFDSITFTPLHAYAMLDDVRVGSYGDPDPLPELGTGFLALGGVGLLALGWLRKRC